MNILPLKELAKEAFVELKKLQTGEKRIVKTGEEIIDGNIGGLLPGDIVVISGMSGHGKSETLFRMKKQILDVSVNEEAEQYVFLEQSLEMKLLNIVLRSIHGEISKSKRDILFNEFSEEEKVKVKSYYESLQDDRQFVNQSPSTPLEFYNGCMAFLEEHKDKKAVFITVDHMLLLTGSDKQKVVESTVEYINQLKLRFNNVYFILLSQLNRGLLGRVAEKNNNAAPNSTDLFGSSFMDQIASYNIILYNPYKTSIEQYMKVNPERYGYLSEHFGDEDSKGRVSFNTKHKIFYHLEKARESDTPYKDIFIVDMDIPEDQKFDSPEPSKHNAVNPTFANQEPEIKFDSQKYNKLPSDVFDVDGGDDGKPPF